MWGTRSGRTDEEDDRDVSDDERDDHVAHYACHEHRQKAHHGQNRVQAEIVLVVQLRIASHPSVPATRGTKLGLQPTYLDPVRERVEAAPFQERDHEHHRQLPVRPCPDRHRHEWRRRPPPSAAFISRARVYLLEVVFPEDEEHEEEHADDEQGNDVWRSVSARQENGTLGDLHPVSQPSGAVGPSLRMNTMNVSPAVTRMAPTQSTRLNETVSNVSCASRTPVRLPV